MAATLLQAHGHPSPIVLSLHGKGGGSRGSLPTFARLRDLSQVLYLHPAETGRGLVDIKHVVRGVVDVRITVTGWRGQPREIGSPDSAPYADGGDALAATLAMLDRLRNGVLKGGGERRRAAGRRSCGLRPASDTRPPSRAVRR